MIAYNNILPLNFLNGNAYKNPNKILSRHENVYESSIKSHTEYE